MRIEQASKQIFYSAKKMALQILQKIGLVSQLRIFEKHLVDNCSEHRILECILVGNEGRKAVLFYTAIYDKLTVILAVYFTIW